MSFRLTLAQMRPALGDLQRNLEAHRELVAQAVAQGSHLVVFPELSLTGYYLRDLTAEVALRRDDPLMAELAELSRSVSLVVGFVELGEAFDCYVASAYFQGGQLLHLHRKVYLPTYGMFDEERYFSRGDQVRTFATPLGRVGLLICEDLWHPSAVYVAAMDGMHLLIASASSPGRGLRGPELDTASTYERLLGAYAELFQCYVVFVNRVGYEEGVCFWGGSRVVDPAGRTVARLPDFEPGLLSVDLDLDEVRRARVAAPLLLDERLDLTARELQRIQAQRSGTADSSEAPNGVRSGGPSGSVC